MTGGFAICGACGSLCAPSSGIDSNSGIVGSSTGVDCELSNQSKYAPKVPSRKGTTEHQNVSQL